MPRPDSPPAPRRIAHEMRRFGQPRPGRPVAVVGAALAGGLAVALAARMRFERALAAERSARVRADLLGRAGRLLAAPLDPEVRLQELTALAIPDIADVCSLGLLRDDGTLELTAVAAADPAIADAVRDSRARWPIDPASTHPIAVAARTGEPQLVSDITPEHLRDVAQAEGHRERMTRMGYRSGIAVPLAARGRTLGALALMRTAGEPYDERDRDLAAELARRAALAVDNARLFAELTTTERQLEAVLTNLGEAVTVQGPDFGLVYANQAAATLLECASPDELLRTPIAEVLDRFVVLDERALPLDVLTLPGRAPLAGEPPEPVLVRYISRATGEERWMLVKATPVRGDDGRVALAVNIMEDVTETRRAEQAHLLVARRRHDPRQGGVGGGARGGRLVHGRHARRARRDAARRHRAHRSGPARAAGRDARPLPAGRHRREKPARRPAPGALGAHPRAHRGAPGRLRRGRAPPGAHARARQPVGGRRPARRRRPHDRHDHRGHRRVGPAAGARGARAARGGRPPGGHRGGERAGARGADDDRHHAAAQPAAPAAARRARRDDRRALPGGGRGERRGRRLLRPVPARRRLDGGHRRRHRQGSRGGGDHLHGPLHDAHGRGLRALAGGRAGPGQPP